MITCALQGGLGNQMFQIASTIGHAVRCNTDYGFNLDYCHTPAQGNVANNYKDNFYKNLSLIGNLNDIPNLKIFREKRFSYQEIPHEDNICLIGYFQSEKYFKHTKDLIKDTFKFDDVIKLKVNGYINTFSGKTCAVQVRRGDYVKSSNYHLVCDLNYYHNAMNILGNDIDYIFISDDLKWCKDNFVGHNIFYSPFDDELSDLCLISHCDHKIISNSSFGWWGTWLSDKEVVTICPKRWFNNDGPKDYEDVFVESWIKI